MPDPTTVTPDVNDAPPDVQNNPAPPPIDVGAPAAQPTPPPKETLGQGFMRGARGEQYVVDETGRMTNARTTAPSGRGMLGSILAGAVMGALHGATTVRPQGRSGEGNGNIGFGAGVEAALGARQQQDELNRARAVQQFQTQQSAKKMTREEAESAAQINSLAAQTAHLMQETKFEAENHPFDVRMKQAGLDEALANVQNARQTLQKNQLSIIQALADNGIDPSAVVTSWGQAHGHAADIANGKTLPLFNGAEGDDRGVSMFDVDNLRRPLTKDVIFKSYTSDKDGNPIEQVHTIKAGSGSVMDYISGAMQGQAQLQKIMSQQKVAAEVDKQKADAKEARAKAGLDEAQVDFFKKSGINVPASYVPPPDVFSMKPQDLSKNLATQGVTVPANFAALYATAHYKGDLNTFPARPTNRPGMPPQMDQAGAETFIRTFINPNYDRNNFGAVKKMEDEFASSKPGSAGGNLLSFNTATGHLAQLYDASQALQNGDVQALNGIANRLSAQFGSRVAPNFEAIKGVLVGELGRLMKQSAPDVEEMAQISKSLSQANSPEQFKGVVQQYAHAMLQKGLPLVRKYADYTGELPPSTFDPQTLATFQKLGIDVQSMLPQGVSVPVGQTGNVNAGLAAGRAAAAKMAVPANVSAALANVGAGRHTLSDKSVWDKATDGTITKVQ
jgi:hypothetical protein